jgi:hypothetical protein
MFQYIVILGGTANLFGAYSYIRDTIKGETQPNRVTWLMWAIAPLIATAAGLSKGVGWAVLPVFMSGFVPLLVFLASWWDKKAYWKLTSFDYICGALSVLALVLWSITDEPMIAIIFAIASDAFAAVPTLVKSWRYPDSETVIAYITGFFNGLSSFAAVKAWSPAEIAYPIYLVTICSLLVLAVTRGKIKNFEF